MDKGLGVGSRQWGLGERIRGPALILHFIQDRFYAKREIAHE